MRTGVFWFGWACVAAALWATPAAADELDLALSRLSVSGDPSVSREQACQATIADQFSRTASGELHSPVVLEGADAFELQRGGAQTLLADQQAWASLISQLGPALFTPLLEPVTTSGPRGLDMGLDFSFTSIDGGASYWRRGTRGKGAGAVMTCDGDNRFVPSVLRTNRIRFSKGLPLGFELGSSVGRLWNTSLWLLGVELKWALFEGYRTWPLPDLGIRASVTTSVGDSQYTLTTATADAILSKPVVVGHVMRIVPYLGGQIGFIFAASELVDLTPNIDAVACEAGQDPHCRDDALQTIGNGKQDVGHDQPFDTLTLRRYRLFAGLQVRYQMFTLSAEFVTDVLPPGDADSDAPAGLPRQWSFNLAPALSY